MTDPRHNPNLPDDVEDDDYDPPQYDDEPWGDDYDLARDYDIDY